jgi:CRP/FNR family cyclic AMP-dependent transcriptional regulator
MEWRRRRRTATSSRTFPDQLSICPFGHSCGHQANLGREKMPRGIHRDRKMLDKDGIKILSDIPLLEGLNYGDVRQVLDICTIEVVRYNQVVLKEGDVGNALYIVISGGLEVFLPEHGEDTERFSKIVLNTMRAGDFVGEYSLIDKISVSATVAAVEETVLFKITRAAFEDLVSTSDRIGRVLYRNLLMSTIRRLRDKDKELDMFNPDRWAR